METKFFKNIFNPVRIILATLLIIFIFFIFILAYLMTGSFSPNSDIDFGVTFSQVVAEELKINWQLAYTDIVDNLGVKKMRLIAYWSLIENNKGEYSFNDLDWQIEKAREKGIEVVLAVGTKLPGLSKCYNPEWTKELNKEEQQENALLFIKEVINHYSSEGVITTWQIEDKPFQGNPEECINLDKEFLNKEISLVRENNLSNKSIMLTTSGEISNWLKPAMLGDELGISISRNNWTSYLGYFNYPIVPSFYKKRANLTKIFTKNNNVVVIDLQAEPIGSKPIYEMTSLEWDISMNLSKFINTILYAKKSGFDEVYLRGAEWWYYMKGEGNDSFWNEAKELWTE